MKSDPDHASVVTGSLARSDLEPRFVWGCDVSSRAVSVAFTDGDHTGVDSVRVATELAHAAGLDELWETVGNATTRWADAHPPLYVWVEQASGRFVAPGLVYAVGVVQQSIFRRLKLIWPHPVEVRTVPSGSWKKHALGNGAAKKQDVMEWAVELGYPGESQDEADALGIALGGYRMLGLPRE